MALDLRNRRHRGGHNNHFGRAELDPPVRTAGVVVLGVYSKDPVKMAGSEDEQPVCERRSKTGTPEPPAEDGRKREHS
jgi:hypothetical protein